MRIETLENYEDLLTEAKTTVSVLLYRKDGSDLYFLVSTRLVPPEVGRLSVPGGHIEVGEKPRDAAIRETFEETGVDLADNHLKPLVCSFQTFLNSQRSYVLYCYLTAWDPMMGVAVNKEPGKHSDWRWIPLRQLVSMWEKKNLSLGLHAAINWLAEDSNKEVLPDTFVMEFTALR